MIMQANLHVSSRCASGSGETWRCSLYFAALSTPQALLHRLTPANLCQRFSGELRHYCSHALFLDEAVQETQESASSGLLDPLPENWCQFFTHLRVVTNSTPTDVCSTGLHILHIPHTSWCLVSGTLGRIGSEVKEMALTALANSLGAKRVKTAQEALKGEEAVVEMGAMTELSGKDPLALRDILLNAGLLGEAADGNQDHGQDTGEAVPGGKGRSMKRGEAEDGPLTRAEKRQRDDPSGLYTELEQRQRTWQEVDFDVDDRRHPLEQQQTLKTKRRLQLSRSREADEVFGKVQDLPRLDRVRYQVSPADGCCIRFPSTYLLLHIFLFKLRLPFPLLSGYGRVSDETARAHPLTLRLQGSHILAGLRTFVQNGMAEADDGAAPGLPTWLTESRGTRLSIGMQGETNDE